MDLFLPFQNHAEDFVQRKHACAPQQDNNRYTDNKMVYVQFRLLSQVFWLFYHKIKSFATASRLIQISHFGL